MIQITSIGINERSYITNVTSILII